ncbi:hypothetical protein K523DRAFT_325575 [Schizophyllum commune Tattone D]|nr:hypothetical protein K523DRAFT_325575 [Schizophyllum commune Tattone D]
MAAATIDLFTIIPQELINLILQLSDPDALLLFATVCRKLHFLAIPALLARYGQTDPRRIERLTLFFSSRNAPTPYQLHRALIMSLYPTTARHIHWYVQDPRSVGLQAQFRIMFRLVTKLVAIDKFTVDFSLAAASRPSRAWKMRLVDVRIALARVLEAAAARGCRSLAIVDGGASALSPLGALDRLRVAPSMLKGAWALRTCLSKTRLISAPDKYLFPPYAESQDLILLDSPVDEALLGGRAFGPSWRVETRVLDVLNTSFLTSLTLSLPPRLTSRAQWDDVLDRLTLPLLTQFSMRMSRASQRTFCAFLARHPNLRSLDIRDCAKSFLSRRGSRRPPPTLELPRLEQLLAAAPVVAFVLGSASRTPILHHVHVQLDCYWDAPITPSLCNIRPLVPVHNRLAGVTTTFELDVGEWPWDEDDQQPTPHDHDACVFAASTLMINVSRVHVDLVFSPRMVRWLRACTHLRTLLLDHTWGRLCCADKEGFDETSRQVGAQIRDALPHIERLKVRGTSIVPRLDEDEVLF